MERRAEDDLPEDVSKRSWRLNSATERALNWMQLLKWAYGIFRERFEEYFPLVLGPGIVAGTAYYGLDQLRYYLTSLPVAQSIFDERSPSSFFRGLFIGGLLWWLQILVVWIAATFTFASVAVKVLGAANATSGRKIPAAQAFRAAMTQFHKIAGMAFLGAVATILFSNFVLPFFLRLVPFVFFYFRLNYEKFLLVYSVARNLIFVIFGALLWSLGPAIPNLVANPSLSVRDAVRIGLRHARQRRLFIVLWLGACAVCGCLAYFAMEDIVRAACLHGEIPRAECSFFLVLLVVVIVALLAGPVFIGLTVLSFDSDLREGAPLAAPAQ
jgi:hypothetical protein